jgi:hypothetical protein
MGRRPIGLTAMTSAERQGVYNNRRKDREAELLYENQRLVKEKQELLSTVDYWKSKFYVAENQLKRRKSP